MNTPAFPMARVTVLAEDGTPNEACGASHEGMSLRDWFAGQALAGYSATSFPDDGLDPLEVAHYCYALADAMLVQRTKEN